MSPFFMWISDDTGMFILTKRSLREATKLNHEAIIGIHNVLEDENLEKSGVMPKVRNVFEKTITWKSFSDAIKCGCLC